MRQAYEETAGRNTRFELGVRYISGLVQHFPKETTLIEKQVVRMFADLGDSPDTARGRNQNSIRLLARTLKSWRA